MNERSFCRLSLKFLMIFVLCLIPNLSGIAQQKLDEKRLNELLKAYTTARKFPCGQRTEAIQIGREILEKYADEISDGGVFPYIKRDVEKIESEEKNCKLDNSKNSLKALYDSFKAAHVMACGNRNDAIQVGKLIIKKFGEDLQSKFVVNWVKRRIPVIESNDIKCRNIDSLETFFEEFKQKRKLSCGERDEAISLGKFIIEKFADDEINKPVLDFIKKQVAFLEKDEKSCVVQGDFYETKKTLS